MGLPLVWAGLTNLGFALKLPLQGLRVPSDTGPNASATGLLSKSNRLSCLNGFFSFPEGQSQSFESQCSLF